MKTYIFLITASLTIFFSCRKENDSTREVSIVDENTILLTREQVEISGIRTGKPERRSISEAVRANGKLDVPPQNLVTIAAPMGGFVKNTHLLQGMWVKKGESLIQLQDQAYIELQQDYLESKSQLEFAEAEFKRQETLAKENVNAQKTLQQSKTAYESLRARVEALKAKLSIINIRPEDIEDGNIRQYIYLYSPISGYVTEVNVNVGQFVHSTDALFKIVDTGHLHVELYIFEQDIPKLKIGQKVKFSLINENMMRTADVHLIGREIGADRTIRVHCHLDKEDKNLLPGMYVKASIVTDSKETNTVPGDAVINFEGTSYIFTTTDHSTFTMTAIQTGTSQDELVEIILPDKWNMDNEIVTTGAYDLLSRLKNTEEEE